MLRAENRKIYLALIFVFLSISIGAFLLSCRTFAETEVVDVVTVTVPSSCNLTSNVSGGNTYNVNIMPRQYKNDIGPSTFSVFCNNNEGFSIYAIGFSNEEYGNTKMITNDPDLFINTGTNTSGSPSSWAMKLSAVTASGDNAYTPSIVSPYNNFAAVPSSYTKVATVTSVTTGNAEASVQATYAVYVAGDQIAGTYTGKVKYTVVHPASNVPNEPKTCAANKICYWPNAGNTVVDSMGDQSITSSDTSATLWPSNFQRPGYGFVGWSDKFDWELNANDANGNGTGNNAEYHIYGPNATITFTAGQYSGANGGLSLYAVWAPSAGSLQGWNGCSSLGQGRVTALTDLRDNDTYAVAKLADGKCWMIENLRLDYDATHNTDGSLAQGYGGQFAGLAQPETTNFTGSTTSATEPTVANSLYFAGTGNEGALGATIDITQTNYAGFRMPRYRNDNTNANSAINPNTNVANMTGINQNVYGYGNYYSWSASIASTNHYSGPTATDGNGKTSETANTSLCPSDWQLPYGRNTGNGNTPGGFYYLNYKINNDSNVTDATASKKIRSYPNNFVYSGRVYNNSITGRGSSYGNYWSSTAYSDGNANGFGFDNSNVNVGMDPGDKYSGRSIRCVISPSV